MLRLTLSIILISFSITAHSLNVFRLAADEWPPFTSQENDQRIAVDLVQTALIRSGWTPKLTISEWEKIAPSLKAGKFDGVVAEWFTKEREEYLFFSEPYLENRIIAVGLKNQEKEITSISQLKGKRVALVKDYAYGDDILTNSQLDKIYGENVKSNLQLLLDKKVDYLLADELVVKSLLTTYPQSDRQQLVAHKKPLAVKKLYFVVSKKHPQAKIIIGDFNRAIQQMITDGSYNDILGFGVIFRTDEDGISDVITSGSKLDLSLPKEAQDGYHLFSENTLFDSKKTVKYRVSGHNYSNWNDAREAINEGSQRINRLDPDQDQESEYQLIIPVR